MSDKKYCSKCERYRTFDIEGRFLLHSQCSKCALDEKNVVIPTQGDGLAYYKYTHETWMQKQNFVTRFIYRILELF